MGMEDGWVSNPPDRFERCGWRSTFFFFFITFFYVNGWLVWCLVDACLHGRMLIAIGEIGERGDGGGEETTFYIQVGRQVRLLGF